MHGVPRMLCVCTHTLTWHMPHQEGSSNVKLLDCKQLQPTPPTSPMLSMCFKIFTLTQAIFRYLFCAGEGLKEIQMNTTMGNSDPHLLM